MVESAVSRGEALVVLRDGAPVAVLAPTSSVPVGDLPRWEEWINDVRESFAQTTGQPGAPRVPLPDPPQVDKTLLGFDPATGSVGSDTGRAFLASELARLGV